MSEPLFVIVVGTSAGGMGALSEFTSQLDPDMDAAVFIVMHLSGTAMGDFLVPRLQPLTTWHCEIAAEGTVIKKGHIYVASANLHLLVKKGRIILGHGPEENRWRPSIDVLFRSAAAAYSSRVIGVVLTGLLDDGTAGMLAIKRSGGHTIVQDPNEAEYPEMPMSVLNNMEVNYCSPLSDIGAVIKAITQTTPALVDAPRDVIIESEISERVVIDYDNVKQLGEKSIYACPDCGGGLWDMSKSNAPEDKLTRYRCHIGHSYSEKDLVIKQGEVFESTLWIALRIMEERRTLLLKLEKDHSKKGLSTIAKSYTQKAATIQIHIDKMREVLFASQN